MELVLLFKTCLSSSGMSTEIANSGEKALNCFFVNKKEGKSYDAILLDTRLSNPSGLTIAKIIKQEKTDQKLVIVTTTPKEYLPKECLKSAGINEKDILTMPFKMSELIAALRN